MSDRTELIVNRLEQCIYDGEISNAGMLKTFNLSADYLNLETFAERANRLSVSPQAIYKSGVKYFKKFGVKIIIDNI